MTTEKKSDAIMAAKLVLMFFLIGLCVTACAAPIIIAWRWL